MIDFSSFDYKTLRRFCCLQKIKPNSLNKNKLIEKLTENTAILIIQRFVRKAYLIPEYCPIIMEKLVYPFVSIKNPNGHFNYYSLRGITDFYIKTKKFICPNTRYEISFQKIKEISELYSFYYKKKLKTNNNNHRKDSPLEVIWLSRTLIEYTYKIPDLSPTEDTINFVIMPYILNYIYFICLRDRNYANDILFKIYSILEDNYFTNRSLILQRLKEINF